MLDSKEFRLDIHYSAFGAKLTSGGIPGYGAPLALSAIVVISLIAIVMRRAKKPVIAL